MTRVVLMDVEGTTTSISFVHDVLFPYAQKYMEEFVREHRDLPRVQECLSQVKETVLKENGEAIDDVGALVFLKHWIVRDRKHGALKELQGLIWHRGYEKGHYKAHVYPDVLPNMKKWVAKGKILAIFSSGSVNAQKLLFKHTVVGDLTGMISHYFDTTSGPKKKTESYQTIAASLEMPPSDFLFLSDIPAELNAAREAGMEITHLVRPGTEPLDSFPGVGSFSEIKL